MPLEELQELVRELWGPTGYAEPEDQRNGCSVGHWKNGRPQGLIIGGTVVDMIPTVRKLLDGKRWCEERKKNNGV